MEWSSRGPPSLLSLVTSEGTARKMQTSASTRLNCGCCSLVAVCCEHSPSRASRLDRNLTSGCSRLATSLQVLEGFVRRIAIGPHDCSALSNGAEYTNCEPKEDLAGRMRARSTSISWVGGSSATLAINGRIRW